MNVIWKEMRCKQFLGEAYGPMFFGHRASKGVAGGKRRRFSPRLRDSALSILFDRRFEEECLNSCSDAAKQREEELKRQGWTRMFIADEPRLSEAVELYKSLGYEVHLEPTTFNEADETCRACLKVNCRKCWTIYTRKKDDASEAE